MPSPGSVRQVAGVWKCADGGSCTGREAVNRRRTPSAFGRADTGTVQCSSREPCRLALGRFIFHAKASGTGSKTPGGAGTHTGHTGTRYCSQVSAVVGEPRCAHTGTVQYTVPKFSPLSPCLSSRCSPGRRSTPSTPLVFFVEHARRRPQSTDSRQRSAWHCWDEHVLGVPRPFFGPCFFSRSIAATACPRR